MNKIVLRIVLVFLIAPILLVAASQSAHADVSRGQRVTASNYSCGSNERVTGDTVFYGPVPTRQRAMIYRNCASSAVYRRADVKYGPDGPCYRVPGGAAIVLEALQILPSRDAYRDAKAC